MNKEEILNKYIDLIDKGYCCACNELNCIDNFPHTKITQAIRELQQQNQKYKEVIDKAINNSQYWIDYYTRLNSDERIALRLQENIDILKEVE